MPALPQDTGTMIRMAREGDREALGRLLENYRPYLKILAERRISGPLGRRASASDIVQQTFLEAHRDFAHFTGTVEGELVAWLKRILEHNLSHAVRDHVLAQKRSVTREIPLRAPADSSTAGWQEPSSGRSSPSQRAMVGEDAIRLAQALEQLPADQREAVRLRHLEGWSLAQIAELLDRSPAAAAGLIKRGMQALRQTLAGDESQTP